MFQVLVHYSGAVPAEFYSRQKRPGYADYQRRVPRFFPWSKADAGPQSS
jgi:steroid 5-alpha reductase family enzyme